MRKISLYWSNGVLVQPEQPSEKGQEINDPWGTASSVHPNRAVLDEDYLHTISRGTSRQSRSFNSQIMFSAKGSLDSNSVFSSKAKVFPKPSPSEEYDDRPSEDASYDDFPKMTSGSRAFQIPAKSKESAKHPDTIVVSSNDDDTSDDPVVSPSRRKRSKPTAPDHILSDDGSDQGSVRSTTQKSRSRRLATRLTSVDSRRSAIHVADELKDDLHDLRDTGKSSIIRFSRENCRVSSIVPIIRVWYYRLRSSNVNTAASV